MGWLVYGRLSDILASVRIQLQATTQEDWLKEQSAADLAGLLATELDRAIRLLSGLKPAQPELPEANEHRNGAVDSAD